MTTPPLAATERPGTSDPGRRAGGRRDREVLPPRLLFLLRRLGRLLLSLVVVVVASFFLVHLVPGDPVRAALGPSASVELVEGIRAQLGLDKPLPAQFADYVGGLLTGDLGTSVESRRSVGETIAQRFPATFALAMSAFVVAVVGAVPVGIGTAVSARGGRRRGTDAVVSAALGLAIAVPGFLLAVGLIALFGVQLRWLPAAGWGTPRDAVLPVVALAIGPMAYLARIVGVEMLTVLDATYITTARSKRLPARIIHLRHALPNIITSTLTIGGLVLSGLMAATVLVETIFAIPGMGTMIVDAVAAKDFPVVQGVVIVFALIVLGVNLLVDLVLVTVDPRSAVAEA